MATADQIKLIHVLRTKLGMDDDTYREALKNFGGVKSSKDLPPFRAKELIDDWTKTAKEIGVWESRPKSRPKKKRNRTDNLDAPHKGPGGTWGDHATPAQLALVKSLWAEAARNPTDDALQGYIKRIARVDSIRFLTKWKAHQVIEGLHDMLVKKLLEVATEEALIKIGREIEYRTWEAILKMAQEAMRKLGIPMELPKRPMELIGCLGPKNPNPGHGRALTATEILKVALAVKEAFKPV